MRGHKHSIGWKMGVGRLWGERGVFFPALEECERFGERGMTDHRYTPSLESCKQVCWKKEEERDAVTRS